MVCISSVFYARLGVLRLLVSDAWKNYIKCINDPLISKWAS